MAAAARKPAAKRKTASPNPRKKVLQISWVDRIMRILPISEEDVQPALTWIFVTALAVLLVAIAQYAGVTAAAFQQYAALAA